VFRKKNDSCITFSLTKSVSYIRPDFEAGVNAALTILNSYFDKSSPNWLGYPKFENAKPHECYFSILNIMAKRKKPIGNTRKRQNKYTITQSTIHSPLVKHDSN
jgi:hypothetical protein